MQVVEVDVVGAQGCEALVQIDGHFIAVQARHGQRVPGRMGSFGSQDDLVPVAPGLHPVADVDFTMVQTGIQPATINICCVDEIAACSGVQVQLVESKRLGVDFAQGVAAKADHGGVELRARHESIMHG